MCKKQNLILQFLLGGGRKERDDVRAAERKRLTELVKATAISIAK